MWKWVSTLKKIGGLSSVQRKFDFMDAKFVLWCVCVCVCVCVSVSDQGKI